MHEFARTVAKETGLSEEQALAALRVFLDAVIDSLVRDRRVQFDHFGVFELKVRRGRRGRNPRTGESVTIPDKVRARFRPGQTLVRVLEHLSQQDRATEGPGSTPGGADFVKPWWQFWR